MKEQLLREYVRTILLEKANGLDDNQAREILKKFPKGLAQLGVDPSQIDQLQVLGVGTRGAAFAIGDKVLKVTADDREAQAAARLIGSKHNNLVKVYKVIKFGKTGAYGVFQEKLNPLPSDQETEFNNALVNTGLPVWIKAANYDWGQAKVKVKQYILKKVKDKVGNFNSPEAQELVKKANADWQLLVNKYKIGELFDEIKALGVNFSDFHAGNLMRRADGTLVIIDLGNSVIQGADGHVDSIEERKHR